MPDIIRFRRAAKELLTGYFTHQNWKAHDGLFMPVTFEVGVSSAADGRSRLLRKLTGVSLPESEARAAWQRVLEHKWYLGERLGRDVGLRVAAVDYFENVQPSRRSARTRSGGGLPPRLPMMMPFGRGA